MWRGDRAVGWGEVEDSESIQAIHRAMDLGITFFDTSDVYGTGHSERVLGRALAGKWDQVFIATKFGNVFDEETRQITDAEASPAYVRQACEASLRRLNTDVIDLYQLHIATLELDQAAVVRATLEDLVQAGKIRWYGWSTDDEERAAFFGQGEHCAAIQHRLNIFEGNTDILDVCAAYDLASINRTPLSKGLLTGRFDASTTFPEDDVRHGWDLSEGEMATWLEKLDAIREILTSEGRTLAQGALAWIWGRSERTIPIPGFRTVSQVVENAQAMEFGPLTDEQMAEIDDILDRSS
jgi:aryl-alcohol dehydrogenase-like predicted oxidoreductase